MHPSILPDTYDSDGISAPIELPDESPDPEAIRRAHINAETSIKAIGQLVLLAVVVEAIRSIFSLGAGDMGALGLVFSIASLVAAAFAGAWLCAFDPKGRLLYTLLSIVQLVLPPFEWQAVRDLHAGTGVSLTTTSAATLIGLLVRLLFLYMLWNRKGRMVMSRHYRETIIPATPRVEYRSRLPLLIGLGVLLMIFVMALAVVGA